MTSELRPAVSVAEDCHWEYEFKSEEEAAAVIEADREAVRAEQAAEIAALKAEREADHENINLKADFIEKTINQLAEQDFELAKWKALAETLAGAGAAIIKLIGPKDCRLYASDPEVVAMANILREYKEQRDA